jgi:hypothetical protein
MSPGVTPARSTTPAAADLPRRGARRRRARGGAIAWLAACAACPAVPVAAAPPADRDDVLHAASRARGFLESLAAEIDPVRLRAERGMKGKKFYVEYLWAWEALYQGAAPAGQAAIREFLAPIVERSTSAAYHNLDACPDTEFKEEIISYLSACVLQAKLGFETAPYRERVRALLPRILSRDHLAVRGVDNSMAIAHRLRQLGFDPGVGVCQLWARADCLSRTHPDVSRLALPHGAGWPLVYKLTHEVFFLTDFGRTPIQCAGAADLEYLRDIHAAMVPIGIAERNVDLLAELIMVLNYLDMTDLPQYGQARQFVLHQQNGDGSWGDPGFVARRVAARHGTNPNYLPSVGQHLHTTLVALQALLDPEG